MQSLVCVLAVVLGQVVLGQAAPAPSDGDAEKRTAEKEFKARLLELYEREASDYTIYRDDEQSEKLEFRAKPIYAWTNPTTESLQQGVLYVWTHLGCAEVVGGAWSQPLDGRRSVYHEFDSFSTVVLKPVRSTPGLNVWRPRAAVERRAIPDAPPPKETAKARLLQLGTLARGFSAHTVTPEGQRWELRLLSKPMYRYESANPDVLDGAVFAFTSTAGTDCEAIMAIEARHSDLAWEWQYAFARLSVFNLYLEHSGREVWSQELGGENTATHDPKRTFDFYFDKAVDEIADDGRDGRK